MILTEVQEEAQAALRKSQEEAKRYADRKRSEAVKGAKEN